MTLGLDLYGTITSWPVSIRKLAKATLDSGGEVHIVSAIKQVNSEKAKALIRASRVPYTAVHLLYYKEYDEIPQIKIPKYRELGCDLVLEDNEAVVNLGVSKGLCVVQIHGDSSSPLVYN